MLAPHVMKCVMSIEWIWCRYTHLYTRTLDTQHRVWAWVRAAVHWFPPGPSAGSVARPAAAPAPVPHCAGESRAATHRTIGDTSRQHQGLGPGSPQIIDTKYWQHTLSVRISQWPGDNGSIAQLLSRLAVQCCAARACRLPVSPGPGGGGTPT